MNTSTILVFSISSWPFLPFYLFYFFFFLPFSAYDGILASQTFSPNLIGAPLPSKLSSKSSNLLSTQTGILSTHDLLREENKENEQLPFLLSISFHPHLHFDIADDKEVSKHLHEDGIDDFTMDYYQTNSTMKVTMSQRKSERKPVLLFRSRFRFSVEGGQYRDLIVCGRGSVEEDNHAGNYLPDVNSMVLENERQESLKFNKI